MFRLRHVGLSLFLLACGSGDAPGVSNPPPPPPPPVPTAMVAQSAVEVAGEPGSPVAARPAVRVLDASGRPLANISVAFAVDSGSGVVTGAAATTGTDGVATVAEWRLGPGEGRHVVSARTGTIAPVKFVAVATLAPVTLPTQVIPVGGASLVLNRPGSAVDGLTLTVPPNALASAATVNFGIRSSASAQLPPGNTIATPIVQIIAPGAVLDEPVLVRVPIPAESDRLRHVSLLDATTGRLIPLPAIEWDAASVTVALPVLNWQSQNPTSRMAATHRDPITLQITEILGTISELLAPHKLGDIDTGFRPGADDWDFKRQPIAGIPNFSPGPTVDPAAAMIETARWYFLNRRSTDGPLWQRFQRVRGIPESNRSGLRWMGVAGSRLPRALENSQVYNRLSLLWRTSGASGLNHLDMLERIKRSMAGDLSILGLPPGPLTPTPVLLFAGTSRESPRFALAFRSVGDALDLAIPDEPGKIFTVQFQQSGITPFTVTTIGGGTFTVTGVSPASMELSSGLRNDLRLPEEWPQVAAGTIGDAQGWRRPKLRGWFLPETGPVKFVTLDTADVPVNNDDFKHWWECDACVDNGFRISAPVQNVRAMPFRMRVPLPGTGSATLPDLLFTSAQVFGHDITPPATEMTAGSALYEAGPGSQLDIPQGTSWFDWITVRYRTVPVKLNPGPIHIAAGDGPIQFSAAVTGAPMGATYRWTFEGKRNPQTGNVLVKKEFTTTVPQLTYQLFRSEMEIDASGAVASMRVRVADKDGRTVGEDKGFVKMVCDNQPVVDARDGRAYKMVCLSNGQIWMGENLQFNAPGSGCYDRLPANCTTFGRLYSWPVAMAGAASSSADPSGVTGACMAGWHVPSPAEWQKLVTLFGGATAASPALRAVGFNTFAGVPPTNTSGMALLGGGFWRTNFIPVLEDEFSGLGTLTGLWTSFEGASLGSTRAAQYLSIGQIPDGALLLGGDITDGRSLRCVRN